VNTNDDPGEVTCGQELAGDAEVPEKLSALWSHVAANMETHADWVGVQSAAARREHEALSRVAADYRAIAAAADHAAAVMKSMADLPAAPHDPTKLDRAAQAAWMRRKIELQRALARMLIEHADVSEQVLAELER
jgi:RIO-like serine/threonine protein kinase